MNIETETNSLEPTPRKSKLGIILGLILLGLLVVGGIGLQSYLGKPLREFVNENSVFLTDSDQAMELLGAPISMAQPVTKQDNNKVLVRTPVSGPKGKATFVLKGSLVEKTWQRDSIFLEMDGQEHDLDPDAMFDIDISFGE
jgi:hypothetical protein